MQVDVDNRVAALIQEEVESGRYANASAVVRDAMRLLEELHERRRELDAALAVGFDQLDRGEVVEWTPDSMARIVQRSEELYQAGREPHPDVCP